MISSRRATPPLRSGALPPLLRLLAEQLRLQREDVIQHAVDAAPLEPVLRDDPRMLERAPQRRTQRSVDADLALHLSLLEDLQAAIQRELAQTVVSLTG